MLSTSLSDGFFWPLIKASGDWTAGWNGLPTRGEPASAGSQRKEAIAFGDRSSERGHRMRSPAGGGRVKTITCPNCGKRNRVAAVAEGVPRCGACHNLLPWIVDADA